MVTSMWRFYLVLGLMNATCFVINMLEGDLEFAAFSALGFICCVYCLYSNDEIL